MFFLVDMNVMLLGVVLHCSLILGIAAFTLAFFVDLKKT
jgi:hypothetical protein